MFCFQMIFLMKQLALEQASSALWGQNGVNSSLKKKTALCRSFSMLSDVPTMFSASLSNIIKLDLFTKFIG